MKLLKIFSFVATLFMTACSAKATNPNVEVVSPETFQTKLAEDSAAYLLDVRKPDEFATGHLAAAHLLNWLDRRHSRKMLRISISRRPYTSIAGADAAVMQQPTTSQCKDTKLWIWTVVSSHGRGQDFPLRKRIFQKEILPDDTAA